MARSSAIVEGTVISSGVASCQSAAAFARRARGTRSSFAPHGVVLRLDVRGEAQVARGVLVAAEDARRVGQRAELRHSAANIISGVPSKRRPQPAANSVSPQKTACASSKT